MVSPGSFENDIGIDVMGKIEIIPAIDIIGGKCVRLSQGNYDSKKVYNENPLEVAQMFEDAGLQRLHLVDLDGARQKQIVNYKVLETIASKTSLTIDFGGGLKSDNDLRIAFESGAAMVTGGSIAVTDPETFLNWLQTFGSERIILGADVRDGRIAVSGWQEESSLDILPFIKGYMEKGVRKAISTDIRMDGMLAGPSYDLYNEILREFPDLYLIASGGISCMDDILKLAENSVPAVITGKAIYEGKVTLKELGKYMGQVS
jgi:phosphoribosylformimino-5-aminoimidazole carboxamide ribotide isomerase